MASCRLCAMVEVLITGMWFRTPASRLHMALILLLLTLTLKTLLRLVTGAWVGTPYSPLLTPLGLACRAWLRLLLSLLMTRLTVLLTAITLVTLLHLLIIMVIRRWECRTLRNRLLIGPDLGISSGRWMTDLIVCLTVVGPKVAVCMVLPKQVMLTRLLILLLTIGMWEKLECENSPSVEDSAELCLT